MSLGYAERLSFREDLGGRLGDPEVFDSSKDVLQKIEQLTELVRSANKVIAFTGAGISTACGIPDFRGPNGVWTRQRQGLPLPKAKTSFLYAQPSLTHMALLGLMQSGKLKYICSQNVDSLHLRSGVPRSQLAELHGNCFAERCKKCKTEYVRDFEMDTVGFKPTGRSCTKPGCKGQLVDHILDWEDALPPAELKATEQHASSASLSICLGTSLQIIPAANLPLRTVKSGGSLAIINLQPTPKDKKAKVVLHAKTDQVMATVMDKLGVPIPAYVRTDRLMIAHKATPAAGAAGDQQQQQQDILKGSSSSWSFRITLSSVHGEVCPLPMVASAHVSFYDQAAVAALQAAGGSSSKPPAETSQKAPQAAAAAVVDSAAAAAAPAQLAPVDVSCLSEVLPRQHLSNPLTLPWSVGCGEVPAGLQEVAVVVVLQLVDAADEDKRSHQVHYTVKQPSGPLATSNTTTGRGTRGAAAKQRQQAQQPDGSEVFSFVSQVRHYTQEQQDLVAALTQAAGGAADTSLHTHQQQQQQLQPQVQQQSGGRGGMSISAGACAPAGSQDEGSGGPAGADSAAAADVVVSGDAAAGGGRGVGEMDMVDAGDDDRPNKRIRQCDTVAA